MGSFLVHPNTDFETRKKKTLGMLTLYRSQTKTNPKEAHCRHFRLLVIVGRQVTVSSAQSTKRRNIVESVK